MTMILAVSFLRSELGSCEALVVSVLSNRRVQEIPHRVPVFSSEYDAMNPYVVLIFLCF